MSATNRGGERKDQDNYPTPPWVVKQFAEAWRATLLRVGNAQQPWIDANPELLDPCAGNGELVRAWPYKARWRVIELRRECLPVLRAYAGACPRDFLALPAREAVLVKEKAIVTNPPYSLAMPFIEKSLELVQHVAMLLRLNFLETTKRAAFFRGRCPDVYVLPQRPSFAMTQNKAGKWIVGTDATAYAWFVWDRSNFRQKGSLEILKPVNRQTILDYKEELRKDARERGILTEPCPSPPPPG